MKKLLLILLFLMGCATNAQKATKYCDSNWQGRYDSWQACYDRQYTAHKDNPMAHIGDGLMQPTCTTWNNQTTCH